MQNFFLSLKVRCYLDFLYMCGYLNADFFFFCWILPHSITQPGSRYYTHLQGKFPLESMRLNLQYSLSIPIPSTDYAFEFTAYCFTWNDWITNALQWSCFLLCPHCFWGPGKFTPTCTLLLTLMQNSSWCLNSKEFRKSDTHKSC